MTARTSASCDVLAPADLPVALEAPVPPATSPQVAAPQPLAPRHHTPTQEPPPPRR